MEAPNVVKANVVRQRDIRPIHDKLMVQPIKPEKVSKGGIIIPENVKRPPMLGLVLAAGPGRPIENSTQPWMRRAFRVFFAWLDELSKSQSSVPFKSLVPEPQDFIPNPVKVGDRVLFHRFSGTEIVDNDDEAVILMCSEDVLAVLEPEQEEAK